MAVTSPRDDDGSVVFSESNSAKLLAVESVLISLVIVVVGLRCWCRHYMLRAFQFDDFAMIVALVRLPGFSIHVTILSTIQIDNGPWMSCIY